MPAGITDRNRLFKPPLILRTSGECGRILMLAAARLSAFGLYSSSLANILFANNFKDKNRLSHTGEVSVK
jgi:hypothetical protein